MTIELNDVNVSFMYKQARDVSLKKYIMNSLVGGKITTEQNRNIIHSLININLKISSGERVGIVGHNGAGKTTLLRLLSKIYYPEKGTVNITGKITSLLNIGLGIDREQNGYQNIKIRALLMGMSENEINKKMDEIIYFSGLGEFIYMPFRTYSSGMQLRLAFAVATATEPQILILDEWLSAGDLRFQEDAHERMSDFVSKSEIVIFCSHSEKMIRENSERLIHLKSGKIIEDGPTENIANNYFKK